jgi:hypothetical protein
MKSLRNIFVFVSFFGFNLVTFFSKSLSYGVMFISNTTSIVH